jgi:hypothetical protein
MSLLVASFAPWLALVFNNANWTLSAAILAAVELFAHAPAGHIYLDARIGPMERARKSQRSMSVPALRSTSARTRAIGYLIPAPRATSSVSSAAICVHAESTGSMGWSSHTATRNTSAPQPRCCAHSAHARSSIRRRRIDQASTAI